MPPPPAEGFASRLVLGPALRAQPDRRLVSLVREGYESAFEEIVRRYARPLAHYAGAIVGARAEDITQDAFSKALQALRRDESEIELRPWLYRIVRNTALNDLRDRPEEADELAESIAGGRTAAEIAEQREQLAELIHGLRALPEPQRAAIVMRELEGLSHDEIAAALGLSGGGARQAIYRARQALRDGAALLLPLPIVRFLIDHGGDAATAGAAGGTGGAVVAATGASAAGAGTGGVALKAGVLAAVLAGSVGTGVALRDEGGGKTAGAAVPATSGTAPAVSFASTPPALAPAAIQGASLGGQAGGDAGAGNADDDRDHGGGDDKASDGERQRAHGWGPDRDRGHDRHASGPGGRGGHPPHRRDGHAGRGDAVQLRPPQERKVRPPRATVDGAARPRGDDSTGSDGSPRLTQPPPPPPPSEPEEDVAPVAPEDDGEPDGEEPDDGSRDLRR